SDAATNGGFLSSGDSASRGLTISLATDGAPDYDWFRWTAAQAGTFTATMTTTAGGPLEMHLFTLASDNTLVEVSQGNSLALNMAVGQVVLVEVKGTNTVYGTMTQGSYTLSVAYT